MESSAVAKLDNKRIIACGEAFSLRREGCEGYGPVRLSQFKEVQGSGDDWLGVMAVRNKLIEHGDEKDGHLADVWVFSDEEILTIAPFSRRITGVTHHDRGLRSNVTQLRERLVHVLSGALRTEQ